MQMRSYCLKLSFYVSNAAFPFFLKSCRCSNSVSRHSSSEAKSFARDLSEILQHSLSLSLYIYVYGCKEIRYYIIELLLLILPCTNSARVDARINTDCLLKLFRADVENQRTIYLLLESH